MLIFLEGSGLGGLVVWDSESIPHQNESGNGLDWLRIAHQLGRWTFTTFEVKKDKKDHAFPPNLSHINIYKHIYIFKDIWLFGGGLVRNVISICKAFGNSTVSLILRTFPLTVYTPKNGGLFDSNLRGWQVKEEKRPVFWPSLKLTNIDPQKMVVGRRSFLSGSLGLRPIFKGPRTVSSRRVCPLTCKPHLETITTVAFGWKHGQ